MTQDPHGRHQADEERCGKGLLERAIGRAARRFREKTGLTIQELSNASGISNGMLSKIEHGTTSPSLSTLQNLSRALNVPVTSLFRDFEETRDATFVKAGQGLKIERRGTRAGHQYELLGHAPDGSVVVEPYLITLTQESDVFPIFQHPGLEFLYMLEGTLIYRHGAELFTLEPGDSLFFDSDVPHGPEELRTLPIRFLSNISYARDS
ncbi:MAG: XRE family transcriptional regulator [Pseudomonadota bacterium]